MGYRFSQEYPAMFCAVRPEAALTQEVNPMKLITKIMMCALVATILIQGVSADDPAYVFLLKWGTDGSGDGEFHEPWDVAVDTFGNVYVADTWNDRIQKFSADGIFDTSWGESGSGEGQLEKPFGIAVDAFGNVYVSDTMNNRVQKFSSTGDFIATWESFVTDEGTFDHPYGIAVDSAANVYIADTGNSRVLKFDADGGLLATIGTRGGGDGELYSPIGVAVDTAGNIYVADYDRIHKFDANGAFLTKWGARGSGDGEFAGIIDVAADPWGGIYVSDTDDNFCLWNHRVQKFDSDGTFLTKFGSSGTGDGQFKGPGGIAIDGAGNVYVSDISGDRIQKFVPTISPVRDPPVADAGDELTGTVGWAVSMDGTNSSDPNDNIVSYTWTFSDGGSATGPTTTRVYNTPGTYYATLTVTDATSLSDADTVQVTIAPEPIDNPVESTSKLITDIEALDLPRGTERKVVTKLEEALRYLAHANEKLAAASAELEGEAPDELLDRICAIMESITGESGDLPTLFVTRTSPQVVGAPVSQATENTPDETGSPGSPDTKGPNEHSVKDTKEKKDNPGQNKK